MIINVYVIKIMLKNNVFIKFYQKPETFIPLNIVFIQFSVNILTNYFITILTTDNDNLQNKN